MSAIQTDGRIREERHLQICDLLRQKGAIGVTEMAKLFKVSEMTIRRDLTELEQLGKLHRTHGGAVAARTDDYEPPYIIRASENVHEKRIIGRAAADLVSDGDVIILDVGTTPLQVAKHLASGKRVTVLTNWIPNVLVLSKKQGVDTILMGGAVRPEELSLVGGMTEEFFQRFNANKLFLGVGGVSLEKGLTDYRMDEVEAKKTMLKVTQKAILVADHTKFERVAPIKIAPISVIHTVVTDSGISEDMRENLLRLGIEVLVAQ
ncbi:MAG: DeoR/GlpR transcriptional regulator [Firmicutes bacterium]|nr:DeoR/GlpR transcriptional regulator [Bacillota bacterium]